MSKKDSFRSLFLALVLLLTPACLLSVDEDPGGYCFQECADVFPAGLQHAEWRGDDIFLEMTRCACFIDDGQGGTTEIDYIMPLRPKEE